MTLRALQKLTLAQACPALWSPNPHSTRRPAAFTVTWRPALLGSSRACVMCLM